MKWIKKISAVILTSLLIGLMSVPEAIFASGETEPVIAVQSQTGKAGEMSSVDITIANNSGIAGATLQVEYDKKLTLQSVSNGTVFAELNFTQPAKLESPSKFLWDSERGMAEQDGTILTLQFLISSDALAGETLPIHISYVNGDIFDENLNDVTVQMMDGSITIESEEDCSTAGHKYRTVLEKIPGSEVVPDENECLKQGSYKVAYFCERCGEYDPDSVQVVYTDAKGHVSQETAAIENEIKATHKMEGSYDLVIRCKNCGEILSSKKMTTDKIPHIPGNPVKENEVAATHSTKGSYDLVVYCADENCKEELSRSTVYVDKEDHVPSEAVKENVTEATCEKEGSYDSVVRCSICHEILSTTKITIPKKEHVVVTDNAVKPTYTSEGMTEGAHCSVCNKVLIEQKKVSKLVKKNAKISVAKKTFTYKTKSVKKSKQTFKIGAKVSGNGKLTYKKLSGNKNITVSKTGKVTIKKGTKKGSYKFIVQIKAAESTAYKAKTQKVTLRVKIK